MNERQIELMLGHLERIEALLQRQIDMMSQPTGPAADEFVEQMIAKSKQAQRELASEIDAKRAQEHAAWHALHDIKPTEKVN